MALHRLVGYARVSTREQAQEGISLDAQGHKIRQYATLHDLPVAGIHYDEGLSASGLDRPGLKAALKRLDEGEAGGLVVAKLDRLTRSIKDLGSLLDGYFGPQARDGRPFHLISLAESIDTRTATGRFGLSIIVLIAQWERETIVERTRDALSHKRSLNQRIGTIPYGKRLAADGVGLEDDPREQLVLASIAAQRAAGLSVRMIADALDRAGHATRTGRPWAASTVQSLLGRIAQMDRK